MALATVRRSPDCLARSPHDSRDVRYEVLPSQGSEVTNDESSGRRWRKRNFDA
jgi:hypothetical protein